MPWLVEPLHFPLEVCTSCVQGLSWLGCRAQHKSSTGPLNPESGSEALSLPRHSAAVCSSGDD
eukprot:3373676-Rhodomonas_salina.1